ncbi:hypothetical protein H5410_045826 [Solanum commersonii]|uniref:HMA domain-containing protein n=1 Tax=Solanum commersonii TaxID=4109 RepID=A0A9J5XES9_SOLCO|nr:hypothetical protein H5410_045826 [Solanum commersonii]
MSQASSDFELVRIQTCVLKVQINCHGCMQKVKKLLKIIEGSMDYPYNVRKKASLTMQISEELRIWISPKSTRSPRQGNPSFAPNQGLVSINSVLLIWEVKNRSTRLTHRQGEYGYQPRPFKWDE